uniref:AlbA_2 domain-containing protein n=1 Tax=Caenorhabditis tropicalis TaxID=1561998 RepID=A0A1I7U815_9PELO
MATTRVFEELDFYSDSETNEDFSKYLSDEESEKEVDENENEVDVHFEKANIVKLPEDIDVPTNNNGEQKDEGLSLLDSLLGEALSGEQVDNPVEGLFDDLSDDEAEVISASQLEVDDSGISTGASRSVSAETNISEESKSTIDMSSIEQYLQYVNEEEHAVSVEDIPDFASKKNVYGTSFNVRTGNISRPPRFEFARRDDRWIDSCKILTYDKEKPLNELLSLGKVVQTVKSGMKIHSKAFKFTDVHYRSAKEMAEMETQHIQQIIRDAFNARRLAVILFGVEKDGTITGCPLNAGKQDNLRLALDTAVQTEFVPPVENILDAIDVQFVPIDGVENTFLIVIRIKQLRNQTYRLESSV